MKKKAPVIEETLMLPEGATVGELLKEHRQAMGVPLEIVAHNLRIGVGHLAKLEADDESLVCDVYTLGFLRTYAKFLSLEADALIQQFKEQVAPASSSSMVFLSPPPERGMAAPRVLIGSMGVFLLVSMIAAWWWWQGEHHLFSAKDLPLPVPAAEDASLEAPSLRDFYLGKLK